MDTWYEQAERPSTKIRTINYEILTIPKPHGQE